MIHPGILLFVDDAVIFSIINFPSDVLNLQANLDKFVTRSHQTSLPLSVNECNVTTFSRINSVISFDYKIDNCFVIRVTSVEKLVIIIDYQLSLTSQLNTFVKKSSRCLALLTEIQSILKIFMR